MRFGADLTGVRAFVTVTDTAAALGLARPRVLLDIGDEVTDRQENRAAGGTRRLGHRRRMDRGGDVLMMLIRAGQHDPQRSQVASDLSGVRGNALDDLRGRRPGTGPGACLPPVLAGRTQPPGRHRLGSVRAGRPARPRRCVPAAAAWSTHHHAHRAPPALPGLRGPSTREAAPRPAAGGGVGLPPSDRRRARLVRLTRRQVAIGAGYVTAERPWDGQRKARMKEVIRARCACIGTSGRSPPQPGRANPRFCRSGGNAGGSRCPYRARTIRPLSPPVRRCRWPVCAAAGRHPVEGGRCPAGGLRCACDTLAG